MSEPIGNLIDSLGIEHTPEEGELVSSALVLLKVHDADGNVSLRSLRSPGVSWIEVVGMLRIAERSELDDCGEPNDD